ncbi:hypothetical protein F4677DRAFT_406669 [Hypoxylon crocopeplum]|nr:hypothetical protein F4677DRAFT_406669 [Hypoxylon crocopeplum]
MTAETRSGVRAEAQAHIPNGELIQYHNPDSVESSDDDVEEIPNTSPRKALLEPNLRSLDHRRNRSRQLDDDELFMRFGQSKRQKVGPSTYSEATHIYPYPTPTSSSITQPAIATTSQNESRSWSPEDVVPAGLLNSLNAALKQNEYGAHQENPGPSPQLTDKASPQDNGDAPVQSTHENADVQEPQGQHVISAPGRGKSPPAAVSDYREGHPPDAELGKINGVDDHPTEDRNQTDVWDVPASPPPSGHGHTSASKASPLPESSMGAKISKHRSKPTLSSQKIKAKLVGKHNHADLLEPIQQGGEVDVLEHIDGFSTDDENLSDVDLSAEESFAQDVANFRARHPAGYISIETFQAPPKDDDIAIHIGSSSLRVVLRLMSHRAWTGLKGAWFQRPFNIDDSETQPVRALLQLLAKLERLLTAAPKAPRLEEQNVFLSEHRDLLSYYFSKIKLVIRHIRGTIPTREEINKSLAKSDFKQRNQLCRELNSLAIPMLFHVMASTWSLGGDDWDRASFTISTIEVLRRALGWVGSLYRLLLKGLQKPRKAPEGLSEYQKNERLIKLEKCEELDGLLNDLRQVIKAAPGKLESEERRKDQEHRNYQHSLKRQEQVRARWEREDEEKMKSIQERKLRSLMSIRGIYVPLSQSLVPSSARQSSSSQTLSRISSSRDAGNWSFGEKKFLFQKIQSSYPELPDLDDIRWELDRPLREVEAMAEELLGLMLEAVQPEEPVAKRDAHVREIKEDYIKRTGFKKRCL